MTDNTYDETNSTNQSAATNATAAVDAEHQTKRKFGDASLSGGAELLARISASIAENEDDESAVGDDEATTRERLEALKVQANAALEEARSKVMSSEFAPGDNSEDDALLADAADWQQGDDEAAYWDDAEVQFEQDDAAFEGLSEDGGETGGPFAGVEATLDMLSQEAEEAGEHGADAAQADEPWNDEAAEQLITQCENAGLSVVGAKPDLMIGDDAAVADPSVSYVYLQPDSREIGQQWFEERFEQISKRLDRVAEARPAVPGDAAAELDEKFNALEARLDTLLAGLQDAGPGNSLHDIELCIAEIANQLEATTAELARIETIESRLGEISQSIASRAGASPAIADGHGLAEMIDVSAIADLVAERVAAKPMAFAAGSVGEAGDAAGISDLSAAVKEFMRERRSEGEHANAVLDTMQQTIIRVLDRMEALETNSARSHAMPGTMQHAPAQAAAPAPANAQQQPARPPTEAAAPASQPAAPASVSHDPLHDEAANEAPVYYAEPEPEGEISEEDAIKRLEEAVDQLGDAGSARQSAPASMPAPNDLSPVARRRAEFIAAARQAAANAEQAQQAPAGNPVKSERNRFASIARQAVANATRRVVNDDTAGEEIDATDDGFSINGVSVPKQPKAKMKNRARLLVAALAIVAVGLGATKFLMSRSGEAARHLQSNQMQQGSSIAGDKNKSVAAAGKLGGAAPTQAALSNSASATDDPLADNVKPGTVAYAAPGLVQSAALSPGKGAGNDGLPVSGGPGSVSRQSLPPAMIGPLSLRLAAANGDASAEFQVAARFADGRGVKQDFDEAHKWYRRSAGRGFALAQYRLGTLYERGLGIDKDPQRARVWYERAAQHGNVKAMHNLAVLSAGSSFGQPDYTTAAAWFKLAAEYGLSDSQFNLAILYQNGLGVSLDESAAYKWFGLAAASGDNEAAKRQKELAPKLGKAATAKLDIEVRRWARKQAPKLANDPHFAGQAWQRRGQS